MAHVTAANGRRPLPHRIFSMRAARKVTHDLCRHFGVRDDAVANGIVHELRHSMLRDTAVNRSCIGGYRVLAILTSLSVRE